MAAKEPWGSRSHLSGAQDLMAYQPAQVIPAALGAVVDELNYWFVVGGHAVRCFCPYRPSRDVDFGVHEPRNLEDLLSQLRRTGAVEVLERADKTVHLRWNEINVSIFVLEKLVPFVEDRRLGPTGILATKLHAILDRGTRRDFFDLYVTLQYHRLGIADCLAAMRQVYADQRDQIDEPLLLRSLTYFKDADREAKLPAEGSSDWSTVKQYFERAVGYLLVPPGKPLRIQSQKVDVQSRERDFRVARLRVAQHRKASASRRKNRPAECARCRHGTGRRSALRGQSVQDRTRSSVCRAGSMRWRR